MKVTLGRNVDSSLRRAYQALLSRKLGLDLARGKPSEQQLNLANALLRYAGTRGEKGDYRNYGLVEGIPEARTLFAAFLNAKPDQTFVLGNSSLTIMHDLVVQMLLRPLPDERESLVQEILSGRKPVFLCPVPGYDRHFSICEKYGIEMVPIPFNDDGPDMEAVHRAIAEHNVSGMWCVPKYSNPTGTTYSKRVCKDLASVKAKSGFRIVWDLAYQVHELAEKGDELPNFLELCAKARNPDRAFVIGSTSKVTFASAGLAALASSKRNLAWFKESLDVQNIGPDKLNQLRHVHFLRNMAGVRKHMRKHRAILLPKFEAVDHALTAAFDSIKLVRWNKPRGGYFVSLFVPEGKATRVIEIAASLGVKLTPAGAAFPYGKDPHDSHIRLAPTYPPLSEVREAMEVVVLAIKIAIAE